MSTRRQPLQERLTYLKVRLDIGGTNLIADAAEAGARGDWDRAYALHKAGEEKYARAKRVGQLQRDLFRPDIEGH
ncbi:MAG TPA: hypothetical protein VEW42_00060 [Candidatus Eisenbacteria bacterium]|nr:hypothetical protein [Candidatus Eisenbacteria bacterium]